MINFKSSEDYAAWDFAAAIEAEKVLRANGFPSACIVRTERAGKVTFGGLLSGPLHKFLQIELESDGGDDAKDMLAGDSAAHDEIDRGAGRV